jgi:APA family basic amino acid/polyamine antiporter
VPAVGFVLCVGLAVLLPRTSVLITVGALLVGWGLAELSALRARHRPPAQQEEPPGERAA